MFKEPQLQSEQEKYEIPFTLKTNSQNEEVNVFTTRPDTLFGVTYFVLAPEHALVQEWKGQISNFKEVEAYISKTKEQTTIERTVVGKEKTGVELKGISAINPVNQEEIPVWISDYVLADYGTGAVMGVPYHDERDFAFAKKYELPMRQVIARETGEKRENEEFKTGGAAVVFDPKTQLYGVGEWKGGKPLLFAGGANEGEKIRDAVLREVQEESGLYDFAYIEQVEISHTHYFNTAKKVNRVARAECYVIVLNSAKVKGVQLEEHEKFILAWKSAEEIKGWWIKNNTEGGFDHYIRFLDESVSRLIELGYDTTSCSNVFRSTPITNSGIVENSGIFNGYNSEEAKSLIVRSLRSK